MFTLQEYRLAALRYVVCKQNLVENCQSLELLNEENLFQIANNGNIQVVNLLNTYFASLQRYNNYQRELMAVKGDNLTIEEATTLNNLFRTYFFAKEAAKNYVDNL